MCLATVIYLLFFVKHLGRPVISILTTSAQRERQNYAASLNLLKLHFFKCRRFIWVCFCCSRGRSYKIILCNCDRNNFTASEQPCINKLFVLLLTYFRYRINESTQLVTKCDVWSDLDTWILQQRTDWEQSSNYGGIIFPKHSIVCWIMLVVMGVILFDTFEYFLSTCFKYSAISGLAPAL